MEQVLHVFDALGINLPGLIAQLINFTLLLGLLYLLLYRPVMRVLDERSQRIRQSMEQAEQIREQAQRAEAEFQARLDEARREGQNIISQAMRAGEQLREEARGEARQEAEGLITRARAEIQMERDEAIAELRRQFADLTVMAAGRVINRELDPEAHRQLIEEALAESGGLEESR